jgi:hypothetical protein
VGLSWALNWYSGALPAPCTHHSRQVRRVARSGGECVGAASVRVAWLDIG